MNKKYILTISIIAIFATLVGLFAKFNKESTGWKSWPASCIRFCSEDTENYSNEFLLGEFRKNNISEYWYKDRKVNIYRGAPTCGGLSSLPQKYNETLDNLLDYLRSSLAISINIDKCNQLRYCFEKSDDAYEGWKIFYCDQDVTIRTIFHLIVIFTSITLYGVVLFVYSKNIELRDFHGKWTVLFVATQIVTLLVFPFLVLNDFKNDRGSIVPFFDILFPLFMISVMFGILWITVMIFHVYFTLKNFKSQKTIPYDLSKYAVVTTVLIVISSILLFTADKKILCMMYLFIGILNTTAWIVTGLKIYALSRQPTYSEQARFSYERKWFWNSLKISSMSVMTWLIQLMAQGGSFNLFRFIFADSILLLTSITITIIALEKKKVVDSDGRKYTGISNTDAEKSEENFNIKDNKV